MMNNPPIRLFCVPFAGGASTAFRDFPKHLPSGIEPKLLDFPGHGRRFGESLLRSVPDLVDDLYRQVKGNLAAPYAFFGHSMGALLSHLTSVRAVEDGFAPPRALFLSAGRAPMTLHRAPIWHSLSRDEFRATIRALGGIPPEILDNEDLMSIYEPILRADLQAIETFRFTRARTLDVPMHVLLGETDDIPGEDARLWREETTGPFTVRVFAGGHFYLFDEWPALAALIAETLSVSSPASDSRLTTSRPAGDA